MCTTISAGYVISDHSSYNRYLIAGSKSSNPKGKTAEEGSEDGEYKISVWVISR